MGVPPSRVGNNQQEGMLDEEGGLEREWRSTQDTGGLTFWAPG